MGVPAGTRPEARTPPIPLPQGPIPSSWARLPSLTLLDLGSNVGVCGSSPPWPASTQVHTDATNMGQSCIMVQTSGTVAGVVLGE